MHARISFALLRCLLRCCIVLCAAPTLASPVCSSALPWVVRSTHARFCVRTAEHGPAQIAPFHARFDHIMFYHSIGFDLQDPLVPVSRVLCCTVSDCAVLCCACRGLRCDDSLTRSARCWFGAVSRVRPLTALLRWRVILLHRVCCSFAHGSDVCVSRL